MSKHLRPEYREMRNEIRTMSTSIDALNLNNTIKKLDFTQVARLNKIDGEKLIPLIRKYNGIIYGTTIGASIKNPKIAIRKTSDVDIKFRNEKERKGFVKEAVQALGNKYYVKVGHFGEVVKRKSDDATIIDTHILDKRFNQKSKDQYRVTYDNEDYVKLTTAYPKISTYGRVKGESYSVSAQRKIQSNLSNYQLSHDPKLRDDKLRRLAKDLWDVRLYNSDALMRAYELFKTEKDPVRKDALHKLISKYTYAVIIFSARPDVMKKRKEAEEMYIREGMLKKRVFTSPERLKLERALYNHLKSHPNFDVVKYGTKWLEAQPIKQNKPPQNKHFELNFKGML